MASKKLKQQGQVYHFEMRWSVVHNEENQQSLYEHFASHPNIDKFIFQAEFTSNEGKANPHYQGYFHCKAKKYPKQLACAWNSKFLGIRVAAASDNGKEALKTYCMKQKSRVAGPWADRKIYMGADLWPEEKMPEWQQTMLKKIRLPPGDRTMHWIYDPIGNNGKTKFVKYLVYKHNAVGLAYGHSTDVLNLVSKMPDRPVYIWNLTRAKPANLSELDLYSAMESVKDGFFINLKYETAQVLMNPPHVVVMANHLPKYEHISPDRWKMWQILDGKLSEDLSTPMVTADAMI